MKKRLLCNAWSCGLARSRYESMFAALALLSQLQALCVHVLAWQLFVNNCVFVGLREGRFRIKCSFVCVVTLVSPVERSLTGDPREHVHRILMFFKAVALSHCAGVVTQR